MRIEDDRRKTAGTRREHIISTLSRELDPTTPTSAAARLDSLIKLHAERKLLVSGDIDGLVSAAMLSKAAPGWKAVALIIKSDYVLLHPSVAETLDLRECFGVDVFSSYIDNVSNHVALWGGKKLGSSAAALELAIAHDAAVIERSQKNLLGSPSLWARIEGSYPNAAGRARAAGYRYPLGTAHVLLAMLEVIGRTPKMFDRDYLPWLVANCDGGLNSIRDHAYNVPMWWSSLAAAVGPASLSEHVFQVASRQRPTEFVDAVNRLRSEGHEVIGAPATHLDDNWNLRSQSVEHVGPVIRWLASISGWPDPFLGGVGGVGDWKRVRLHERGFLSTRGLPVASTVDSQLEMFRAGLRRSLDAVHTNFAYFDQAQRLNWVSPWSGAIAPAMDDMPKVLMN